MPALNEIRCPEGAIENLTNINLVVGRNGAGKSRFLRTLASFLKSNAGDYNVSYISPERSGVFKSNANFENNMSNNPNYIYGTRNTNQSSEFKSGSAYLLKQLETVFNRKMSRDPLLRADFSKTFATQHLDKINGLLTNISLEETDAPGFPFTFKAQDGTSIDAANISSGESEIVALATEVMFFFSTVKKDRINFLFLDEPDVHQHPDLQARFARFLENQLTDLTEEIRNRTYVIVATHSSPLICDLALSPYSSIGIKHFGKNVVEQKLAENSLKKAAAFFAHPLSKSISDDPILILEGEDDERIWRQAAQTAQGKIKLYPCLSLSVDAQGELERFTGEMLTALYDQPVGFSVRDGDGVRDELEAVGPIQRFRLQCYAAENLLVTDECLQNMGMDWDNFCNSARDWLEAHPEHRDHALVQQLIVSDDRLRDIKIKAIRNVIVGITGKNKPWEFLVGQSIGKLASVDRIPFGPTNLATFIGAPLLEAVGLTLET